MRIWHRRSLKSDLNEESVVRERIGMEEQDDEDFGDDVEAIPGRYFPNLLKSDEDEEKEMARIRRSNKKVVNNSWPPMSGLVMV